MAEEWQRGLLIDTGTVGEGDRGMPALSVHVNVAASAKAIRLLRHPVRMNLGQLSDNAAYVHYTPNETIGGLEFGWNSGKSVTRR